MDCNGITLVMENMQESQMHSSSNTKDVGWSGGDGAGGVGCKASQEVLISYILFTLAGTPIEINMHWIMLSMTIYQSKRGWM